MARTWLPIELQLVTHRKTRALARLWRCHPYAVVGFLVALWGECLEFQPDGNLSALSDEELDELAAPCRSNLIGSMALVREDLRSAGFVDPDGRLHDWTEYAGAVLRRRETDKLRKRIDRTLYPSDWRAIANTIRFDRAGGQCECTGQCGRSHPAGRCGERHNPSRRGRSIIEVAHLDRDPSNCAEGNLLAMCLPCHKRYDAPGRITRDVRETSSPTAQHSTAQREAPPPAEPAAKVAAAVELLDVLPAVYRGALQAALQGARHPAAVVASLRALGPGGIHHQVGVTWEHVGRALQDWASSGEPFRVRTIEIFVGELRRRAERPSGPRPQSAPARRTSPFRPAAGTEVPAA